ncbi:putative amino acid ligase found clustered with an amidotransferase [hydrocarbon metagenome]|uniref:Putative amino acid ligase found clustered with an amidotransferase n=1 Tax=hydrocarbon metagenome TaxID=938273 RepID=A0A0W8E2L0_9ZZZZ
MKKLLAITAGKILIFLSRMLGNQGTDFPGRAARKIYPGILKNLAGNIQEEIFIVTGTNGKTTTTNMIASILRGKGYSLVHNTAGANMLSGITTAFIEASDLLGRRQFDYALLEVDEAFVPLLIKEARPRVVIITNFFRDQLDRYGELDHTINLIKDGVRETDIELVLNGDDPLISHFHNETGLHCWYYGFDQTIYDTLDSMESREGRYCVFCGHELDYKIYHYAQLGQFSCPQCANHNPDMNFLGNKLKMNPFIEMNVNDLPIKSPYQGFYNAYNILAAVSAARLVGIEDTIIQKAIAGYRPRAGRMENFIINGKRTVLILVKNPTGLNQTLSTLLYDTKSKNLFIALNDNAADGRDISWIWDADVEMLADAKARIAYVVCSGQRSGDMAVRIKYSGIDFSIINIKSGLDEAIEMATAGPGETNYILSTYTALFECQKILKKLEKDDRSEVVGQRQLEA